MPFLARYFKQEAVGNVRADVDLVIRCLRHRNAAPIAEGENSTAAGADAAAGAAQQLACFPAHSFILDDSKYFMAQQAKCWQPSLQQPRHQLPQCQPTVCIPTFSPHSSSSSSSSSSGSSSSTSNSNSNSGVSNSAVYCMQPTVHLTIDSVEQLPAAEAVIAAMYGVPDAISSLDQQQMLHAVVIADMVAAEAAGQQALQALQAAAKSEQGLTSAALDVLIASPVWPACLLQLLPSILEHARCWQGGRAFSMTDAVADTDRRIQQVLVAALGDLHAVWSDDALRTLLLKLTLSDIKLLLSSDQLRVPSKDTVLYTAKQYVRAQTYIVANAAAGAALAQLVRAPQLSLFALACAAQPADSEQQMLGWYAQKLRDLLPLKMIASAEELPAALKLMEGAPASWQCGPRHIKPLEGGVRLLWRLPLEQLQQACKDSFAQQKLVDIISFGSPPLGGVAWRMMVECRQREGGTVVGLYVGPVEAEVPASMYFRLMFTVSWRGVNQTISGPCSTGQNWGYANYFELQPMRGDGWDEAAWAAAGMPTAGETQLELCLHSVQ